MVEPGNRREARWTFLTSHTRVLVEIARNPRVRLREVAAAVGITERAAQAIVGDLEAAGCLTRTRVGRRNHYTVNPEAGFRHPAEAGVPVAGLLALLLDGRPVHRPEEPRVPEQGGPGDGSPAGQWAPVEPADDASPVT